MTAAASRKRRKAVRTGFLEGQLLIAMPTLTGGIFSRSVVYMCMHNEEGAMGLIINQRADSVSFPKLLSELGVLKNGDKEKIPAGLLSMPVQIGGPVDTGRGFVLHSADYSGGNSTLAIDGETSLTNTIDILKAMARGRGPHRAILTLGYAGWKAGQLEDEIQANGWLSCAADSDLVFDADLEFKYDRALSKLGIELSHLVNYSGHA
ncbi:MAG: YqgE/AlgH family protein [Hyphomicrobiaceae bacterium]